MYQRTVPYTLLIVSCIFIYNAIYNYSSTGSPMKEIILKSSGFTHNQRMPSKYTCDGENISPDLSWTAIPQAQSYALIVDDPDAPSKKNPRPNPFVHWVALVPGNINSLRENASISAIGGIEGKNDFPTQEFGGACPPNGSGPHDYHFKIYALDINIPSLGIKPGATKDQVLEKMRGHVIGEGLLIGYYERY